MPMSCIKCESKRIVKTTDFGGPLVPMVCTFRCKGCDLKFAYDRLSHEFFELGYAGRSKLIWVVVLFGLLMITWLMMGH